MDIWVWILGWVLSSKSRPKTNAFIVSLTVADFSVGLSVIPSLFLCDVTNTCHRPHSTLGGCHTVAV